MLEANHVAVAVDWQLGEYISRKIASAEWGDGVVEDLASADEVVEYALARTTSPTLVAEYQTVLPPKVGSEPSSTSCMRCSRPPNQAARWSTGEVDRKNPTRPP